ncbi:MAG: OmpH family outer membrane protein [Verrucomicrobia bacterium]|nr:OmpH family outer membrane protein [Verrucomicrobiota bacterium]
MKNLLRKIVPALLLISLMGAPAWGQGRFATVDMRKVFDNYWKTKQADAALKERAADIEKEHKNMLDDYKKLKEEYQTSLAEANNQNLSLEEREKRKKTAEDNFKKIKESEELINQYERQARTTLDEQKKRMRDSIVDEIRTAINGKAKGAGYSLVFDTAAESATGTPVVLFSNGENEISEAVLSVLNAGAPADISKPDEKKPDVKDDRKKGKK